jgi:hypothetical protein
MGICAAFESSSVSLPLQQVDVACRRVTSTRRPGWAVEPRDEVIRQGDGPQRVLRG